MRRHPLAFSISTVIKVKIDLLKFIDFEMIFIDIDINRSLLEMVHPREQGFLDLFPMAKGFKVMKAWDLYMIVYKQCFDKAIMSLFNSP